MTARVRAAAAIAAAALAGAAPARASDGPEYSIDLAEAAEIVAGERTEISLSIAPSAGFSISRDGPLRVEVGAEGGLELPRRRYRREHAADPRARAPRFDLRVRAPEPGAFELRVELSFWLCRRRTCVPVSDTRAVTVTVRASPAGG